MVQAFAAAPVLTAVLVGSTVISAGAGIFAAVQSSRAAAEQREAEELREQQFALQGIQEGNRVLEEQLAAIAQTNVAAAASGIETGTGSPAARQRDINRQANRQLRNTRLNTAFNVESSRSTQRQLSIEGRASLVRGAAGAVGSIGSGAQGLAAIG